MASITVTHSRAEGTLISDSQKGDGVWEIVRQHRFRSSRSLGALYVPHSRDREADHWLINRAKAALEEAGHTVTVEIDEENRRTFAEREADLIEKADDRAERFSGYSENAAASSDAHRRTAEQISDSIPFGQPILVGHHSEGRARRDAKRMDDNLRAYVQEGNRAQHWENRATAAENYEKYRYHPQRTMRRLDRLRAELRQQERHHGEALAADHPSAGRHDRLIRDLKEEIAGWEAVVAQAEADGVKIWRPDDFAPTDFVRTHGDWYEVVRVNPKTLSIAWNLRLAPKAVMTVEDATDNGRSWTHPVDYTNVTARCPGNAMRALLAEGKVPGLATAREACALHPAETVRAELEARPKPKAKRSDPNTPKKVRLECGWDATEATLTWLTGGGAPHPGHAPVALHPEAGHVYHGAVSTLTLLQQVTDELGKRGLTYRGRWQGGGKTMTCTIKPDPNTPTAQADTRPELEDT